MFTVIYHWILDALFPRRCFGCGTTGSYCCAVCFGTLEFKRLLACPGCGEQNSLGEFCSKCTDGNLNGLWYAQNYGHPLIKQTIKACKYDSLTELITPLGDLLVGTLRAFSLPPAWHSVARDQWQLTPVPLAASKQRLRGFNQAELLARYTSEQCNLPISLALIRTRATKKQSEFKKDTQRLNNVQGAFALSPNQDAHDQIYILVDDVYTSGATMQECAHVLKNAGAREVWGLVVAKG